MQFCVCVCQDNENLVVVSRQNDLARQQTHKYTFSFSFSPETEVKADNGIGIWMLSWRSWGCEGLRTMQSKHKDGKCNSSKYSLVYNFIIGCLFVWVDVCSLRMA